MNSTKLYNFFKKTKSKKTRVLNYYVSTLYNLVAAS